MQRRAVGASAGGGDALLSIEDASQRRPTGFFAGLTQPCADHLQELIGDHGDEQMSFGTNRLVVIDRSQTASSDFNERNTASRSVRVL